MIKNILLRVYSYLAKKRHKLTLSKRVVIYPNTYILNCYRGEVKIGANSRIGCFKRGYWMGFPHRTRLIAAGGNIIIGENCEINGANIVSKSSIEIGDFGQIASGVQITDCNGHEVYSFNRRKGCDSPQPIVIGCNVWIGLNSIILKGAQIGDNCVVGAGSIVKGSFPANCIIQGNPAVIVKHLDISKFK